MRDTFYVGYEPSLKLWEVSSITHTFEPDMWVFRVAARNEHEALLSGLGQYQQLMAPPSPEQNKLFDHVRRQVGKLSRILHEAMIIEIPPSLVDSAKSAADQGYFTMAGIDEVILNTSDAGWKAIQALQAKNPAKKVDAESELAFG